MNKTLQISLTVDEVNIVFQALGTLPHNQVRPLIDRMAQEAQQQIAAAQASSIEEKALDPAPEPGVSNPKE
jgi:hypothetical protein